MIKTLIKQNRFLSLLAYSILWALNGKAKKRIRSIHKHFIYRPFTADEGVIYEIFQKRVYKGIFWPYPDKIEQTKVIFDIGAHIGIASLYFRGIFPEALIVCVEPECQNARILKANLKGKSLADNGAIWHKNTALQLEPSKTGSWGYTVTEGKGIAGRTIPRLMDLYFVDRIDLMKMDIEGAEKILFEHPCPWLSKVVTLIIETHDDKVPGCLKAVRDRVAKYPNLEVIYV